MDYRRPIARSVTSVLVEGGGRLAASIIRDGLADRCAFFIAPLILGGDAIPSVAPLDIRELKRAPILKDIKIRKIGADTLIEGGLCQPRPDRQETGR